MLLQELAGHDAELWSCPAALPIAASLNVKDLLQRFRRRPGQRPSLIHAYVRQQIKQYVDDNWTSDHPIHSGSVLRHLSWIEQTVERRGGMAFDPDQVGPSAVDAVALRRIVTTWTPVVVGGIVGGLSLLCLWPTFDLADVVFQHPPRASIAGIRPAVLIATGYGTLIGLLVAKAPPLRLSGDVQWSGHWPAGGSGVGSVLGCRSACWSDWAQARSAVSRPELRPGLRSGRHSPPRS